MFRTGAVPAVLGTILLLACCDAFALCKFRPLRTVGDTATDSSCTDNDIQSAINNAVGDPSCPTDIAVTREHIWTSQHLSIAGKSLNFIGQADGITCSQVATCGLFSLCPTTAVTTLSASGFDRVLTISGSSNVILHGLTITGGNSIGNGGGISFAGSGSLTLDATSISLNTASSGGGVDVNGSGGTATLYLLDNTLVISNTANNSGGGIRLSGTAQLQANAPQTLIGYNHALAGYGGGVQVLGPARADIGSTGYGSGGVISGNDAVDGGGIAVFAGQDGDFSEEGLANFYATDAHTPVAIDQNFASSRGGAIYAKGYITYTGTYNYGTVCMQNYRISGNAAPDGAIAYLDWDTDISANDLGSRLFLNTATCGNGGVACAPGAPCNIAYDNLSQDASAKPTGGSAFVVGTSSTFRADRLDLRGSNGSYLIYVVGDNDGGFAQPGLLRSCLLADNNVSQSLITIAGNNASIDVDNCTIANNAITSTDVFAAISSLTNSLVFEPGKQVYSPAATYVLANDIAHMPSSATVQLLADPRFVDAANGNYHLRLDSPAVDYAGGLGGTDLAGYPRDIDLPTHANAFGPRDLGAYERQSAFACDDSDDALFCATFDP